MEFDIRHHTHYLIISGSHAYGTAMYSSDYDLRGIAIPPPEYFLGFNKKFEQNDQKFTFEEYPFPELKRYITANDLRTPEPDEGIDHCIYDIRKFFKLAADCNPNVLEILFVDENEILYEDHVGKQIRDHREDFISARAKHTFSGYAVSQLKRINTHRRWLLHPPKNEPTREQFGLPERTLISADQRAAAEKLINEKVREWLLQDTEIDKTALSLFHTRLASLIGQILSSSDLIIKLSDENELLDVVRLAAMEELEMADNYMAVVQAEKGYQNAHREWKQYQSWKKNRNPERARLEAQYFYDTKHGMHLVRLLSMAKEILITGKVFVKRNTDEAMLREVKDGGWSYEELIQWANNTNRQIDMIYNDKIYVVPHKPDMNKLNDLCNKIVFKERMVPSMIEPS